MAEQSNALILIPDISGFTDFVNQTEIEHSAEIIQELLKTLVESNFLDLSISEIEGDAILFYRNGKLPAICELMEQVREMFKNFHLVLQKYDADLSCLCCACRTASGLNLKIIAHYGKLMNLQVGAYRTLHGRDIILAHKLLKNKIDLAEYVLFSGELMKHLEPPLTYGPLRLQNHSEVFGSFGEIPSAYYPLEPYRSEILNGVLSTDSTIHSSINGSPAPIVKLPKLKIPIKQESVKVIRK